MGNLDNQETAAPKRRRRHKIVRILFALALGIGLLISLAPSLLSTQFGSKFMLSVINQQLAGSVKIETLSLSWFGEQSLYGISFRNTSGDLAISIEEFSTEWSLFDALVSGDYSLGKTRLHKLEADVSISDEQPSPAVASEPEPEPVAKLKQALIPTDLLPADLLVDFQLSDAKITIRAAGKQDVVIADLKASIERSNSNEGMKFQLSGRSRQGQMSGSFRGHGRLAGVFSANPKSTDEGARAEIEFVTSDLPADGIDAMLGQQGLLATALGDKVNLKLVANLSGRTQDIEISMDSPNLHFGASGRVEAGEFSLREPAILVGTMTPELFTRLAPATRSSGLRLKSPLNLQLTVARLDVSVSELEPANVAIKVRLESLTPTGLTGDPVLGDLDLTGLRATLGTDNLAESIDFEFELGLVQAAITTTVKLAGKAEALIDQQFRLHTDRLQLNAEASLEALPTALADRLLAQGNLFSELFGPRVDLVVNSSSKGSAQGTINIRLASERLSITDIELSADQNLSLIKPVVARGILTKGLLRQVIAEDQALLLGADLPVTVTLESFTMPRPQAGQSFWQPAKASLDLTLATGSLELTQVPQLGDLIVGGLEMRLSGASLADLRVTCVARLSQADSAGAPGEFTNAAPLRISLEAVSGISPDLQLAATDLSLQIDHQKIACQVKLRIAEDLASLQLAEPANLKLRLTPELLASFAVSPPTWPTGVDSVPVSMTLSSLSLGLGSDMAAGMQLAGKISLEQALAMQTASLDQFEIAFAFNGTNASASIHVDAKATLDGQEVPGVLSVDATLSQLLNAGELAMRDATVDASLRVDALPTALIEELAGQDLDLAAVLGQSLDLDIRAELSNLDAPSGQIRAKIESKNFTAEAAIALGESIELSGPARLSLVLTPRAYDALTKGDNQGADAAANRSITLAENATIEAVIASLHWPNADATDPETKWSVQATLSSEQIRLTNQSSGATMTIAQISATANSVDLAKALQIEVSANFSDQPPAAEQQHFNLDAKLSKLLDADGRLDPDHLTTDLQVELRALPVALLDDFIDSDGLLLAVLGERLDLSATSTLQGMAGPLHLELEASHARANLDGYIVDMTLHLSKPLTAELDTSPELGQKLLAHVNPFLKGIRKTGPLKLQIQPDGFSLPLQDFTLAKLEIARADIDIGQVTVENDQLLQGLLSLAKRRSTENTTAWFTPAVIAIQSGRVNFLRRLDILFDRNFHVATWGTADLTSGRYQQTVALTQDSLARYFKLEHLDPNDMFRIPIQGSTDLPRIDFTSVAADMARLQAEERAMAGILKELDKLPAFARSLLKGQARNATQRFTRALGSRNRGSVPPPSQRPLPWQ